MPTTFNNTFAIDRRLFKVEIRAGIAHCNALFRAGFLTRLEAERIKNALWTLLKRADFDRYYFDSLPANDVFAFIEARVFQLINEGASKLSIGRSRETRAAVALRLWQREEISEILDLLENFREILHKSNNRFFWAFLEMFERDSEIFAEVLRRTNRMPHDVLDVSSNEALAEIDFTELARELGFDAVSHNAAESASDRDFCLEFASAASFVMLHLSRFANEALNQFPAMPQDLRGACELLRAKSGKIFGFHAALLSILKTSPLNPAKDLHETNEIVFETADTIKNCLQIIIAIAPRF